MQFGDEGDILESKSNNSSSSGGNPKAQTGISLDTLFFVNLKQVKSLEASHVPRPTFVVTVAQFAEFAKENQFTASPLQSFTLQTSVPCGLCLSSLSLFLRRSDLHPSRLSLAQPPLSLSPLSFLSLVSLARCRSRRLESVSQASSTHLVLVKDRQFQTKISDLKILNFSHCRRSPPPPLLTSTAVALLYHRRQPLAAKHARRHPPPLQVRRVFSFASAFPLRLCLPYAIDDRQRSAAANRPLSLLGSVGVYGFGGSSQKRRKYDVQEEDDTMEMVQIGAERTKNVLILMSDTDGGHRASAEVIRDAFKLEFGDEYRALKEALALIRVCSRLEALLLKKKTLKFGDSPEIHAQKIPTYCFSFPFGEAVHCFPHELGLEIKNHAFF
nr:monogalactosyldiacylglycerol synthase 2, chloroplastic-like [Ipomoea batatas]